MKSLISIQDGINLTGRNIQVSGHLHEPIIIGSSENLLYLQFHLTNFRDFIGSTSSEDKESEDFIAQRAIFEEKEWKITIDQLQTTCNTIKFLKAQGGYAITHVGKLEKISGEVFTAEQGQSALKALSGFLSFIQGFRVKPLLLVGYDSSSQPIWKEWTLSNSSSWRDVNSWTWGLSAKEIAEAFPGFWNWWHNWGDLAKRVIDWYVESNNQAGSVEGSCILEQATLELIISKQFEDYLYTDEGKKLNKAASKKINYLLKSQHISQEIPSDFQAFKEIGRKLASDPKLKDFSNNAPFIFSWIRNSITHSAPENLEEFRDTTIEARIEAWELGLWYLELVLLHLFNYQGSYFNRLRKGVRNYGDLDPVPWKGIIN